MGTQWSRYSRYRRVQPGKRLTAGSGGGAASAWLDAGGPMYGLVASPGQSTLQASLGQSTAPVTAHVFVLDDPVYGVLDASNVLA